MTGKEWQESKEREIFSRIHQALEFLLLPMELKYNGLTRSEWERLESVSDSLFDLMRTIYERACKGGLL